MTEGPLLPIKVIIPRDGDFRAPGPAPRDVKFFGAVTDAMRQDFAQQADTLAAFFAHSFDAQPSVPAVARVRLKPEAVAKSHRPTDLFNDDTCPIIGGGALGELFVSVQPKGLQRLADRIRNGTARTTEANLSVLADIRPYTADDALKLEEIAQMTVGGQQGKLPPLRFRLFRHLSQTVNTAIDGAFFRMALQFGVQDVERMDYAEGMSVYCLRDLPEIAVKPFAAFVGTQSLSTFPDYRIVRTAARSLGNVSATNFPPPEIGRDYGLVGVIDTGTDPNNPHLQAWVVDRWDWVPRAMQNNDHGSFVAGLIVHGRDLNHGDDRFPGVSSKVVDVVALDKDGEISEYDLITVIDEALRRFPQIKVWNLSLGLVGDPCRDHEFSELGCALDERMRRHGVVFVIAAGNYQTKPYREWPPQAGLGDEDRISPPADAIRGITVGAVAHAETKSSRVHRDEPAPFSRRGPGAAYLLKPELSAPGGNCDANGQCVQTGVVSIDGAGHVAENIGTSFATPLVATLAANVERELSADAAQTSPTLWKALMFHAAFLRRPALDPEGINYLGLGCPPDLSAILNCRQSSATLIFEIPVHAGPEFGKRPFPMPACLVEEGVGLKAEVFMTLLYDPPLDRNFGVEYCRVNVSASLGTVALDPATGKEVYRREVEGVPKELTDGYERDLVKHGFKWSPLKLYYRNFARGPVAKPWRLTLDYLSRAHFAPDDDQLVTLVVTIRDPKGMAHVYDEMVQEMSRLSWGAQDLQVRSRPRLRP